MILIACDSFKHALPAVSVCEAIKKGIQLADNQLDINTFPLADGGEGTAEILAYHSGGVLKNAEVHDPHFRIIEAQFGLSGDGKTAFIEMAQAAGLELLKKEEKNPLKTTTFGVGELILEAINHGVQKIILSIGGSATNDAGMGMAEALGYRFLDEKRAVLKPIGENLGKITHIDDSNLLFKKNIEVEVLCDVDNPLFGKNGAAYTYARQKGADESAIQKLDDGLRRFSDILKKHLKKDYSNIPGAGAAGGLGAGAMAFLKAKSRSGSEVVLDIANFDRELSKADLVITGEGKIDRQSLRGKLIQGIAERAKSFQVPVVAFCGILDAKPRDIQKIGLQSAFSIIDRPSTLDDAIENTARGLENLAFNFIRTFKIRK